MSLAPNRNRRWLQNRCPSIRRPCEGPMDRAAVPSAANRRRRTPRRSMKWQKTRSPFAFSSPRPLRLTLYSRRGGSSDGDRFATPRRKMGVTRSHKTKQLLADLREEESKEEEVVTKSMPIPEGRVGALIESMQETQFKAMLLYAELLKKRNDEDVAGS